MRARSTGSEAAGEAGWVPSGDEDADAIYPDINVNPTQRAARRITEN